MQKLSAETMWTPALYYKFALTCREFIIGQKLHIKLSWDKIRSQSAVIKAVAKWDSLVDFC